MVNKSFSHTSIPKMVEYTKPTVQTIDGNRMYTNGNGVFHSVSFILSALSLQNKSLEDWKNRVGKDVAAKILHDAIQRGNLFHQICESYLKNECVCQYENNLLCYAMFQNVKAELNRIDNIHAIEFPIISEKYNFAGKLDVLGEYNGILSIIDFKSSRQKKKEVYCKRWFLQEAAYSLLVEDVFGTPVGQLVTISAAEDGSIETFVKSRDDFMPEIKSILEEFSTIHTQCGMCKNG